MTGTNEVNDTCSKETSQKLVDEKECRTEMNYVSACSLSRKNKAITIGYYDYKKYHASLTLASKPTPIISIIIR